MTCPITVRLGVYALGAADAAERMLVETHLPPARHAGPSWRAWSRCRGCSRASRRTFCEPIPRPPGCVSARRSRGSPEPGPSAGRKARAAAGRWRSVASVAAAAALGAAGGFWLAQPGASQPARTRACGITLSGANPATHVRVTVTLTGTSWGTSIRLLAWGLPLNQPCRLIVRSRTGGTEVTGVWDAWRAGPVSVPASAGWRPADIASLQVATTSRSLVTVTAAAQAAHVPPSSRPNGARQ